MFFYSLKQLRCLCFNNRDDRDGATKGVRSTPFSSFFVAHLAQPNESSRRRVVAVIKNDWAQPNPNGLKLDQSTLPSRGGGLVTMRKILHCNNNFNALALGICLIIQHS
jgi:hypothetical protein